MSNAYKNISNLFSEENSIPIFASLTEYLTALFQKCPSTTDTEEKIFLTIFIGDKKE